MDLVKTYDAIDYDAESVLCLMGITYPQIPLWHSRWIIVVGQVHQVIDSQLQGVVIAQGQQARVIVRSICIFFLPTLLLSIFTFFCLPYSLVSLSYFNHAVPMHKCLGEHQCIHIIASCTEWDLFFRYVKNSCQFQKHSAVELTLTYLQILNSGHELVFQSYS